MKKLTGPSPEKRPEKPPPGQRGKKRDPDAVEAGRPHQFSSGRARGQPAWLSGGDNNRKTCIKCGVEVLPPGGLILADHAGFGDEGRQLLKGKKPTDMWTYVADGKTITSRKKLGCPVFILDPIGQGLENRAMLREVDDRVDYTDDRVDDVEHRTDSIEDRVIELERQNIELQTKLAERVDVTSLVEWLAEMVALSAAQKLETVQVQIAGHQPAALPAPVANLIIDIAAFQTPERELVPVQKKAAPPAPKYIEVDLDDD